MSSLNEFQCIESDGQVIVNLEPHTTLLTLVPARRDGASDASIHRAKEAQQRERDAVIDARLEQEGTDLYRQQAIDAVSAMKVSHVLPRDLSERDRFDAGAVAVRLHEPRWQTVSHYFAADAVLVELRKSQRLHGWYLADSDLRKLADHLAGVTHRTRLQVWTGEIKVCARTWAKAGLGVLGLKEER